MLNFGNTGMNFWSRRYSPTGSGNLVGSMNGASASSGWAEKEELYVTGCGMDQGGVIIILILEWKKVKWKISWINYE